ncbi:hypothetical protein WK29_20765 [Burkholderia vietnamiensis]|nr:hypothetical protein WK29_20765 [Burkholderia vietnamiensis]
MPRAPGGRGAAEGGADCARFAAVVRRGAAVTGGVAASFAAGLASGFAPDLAPDFSSDFARSFASELACGLAAGLAPGLLPDFTPGLASDLACGLAAGFEPGLASDFLSDLASGFASDLAPRLTPDFARDFRASPADTSLSFAFFAPPDATLASAPPSIDIPSGNTEASVRTPAASSRFCAAVRRFTQYSARDALDRSGNGNDASTARGLRERV